MSQYVTDKLSEADAEAFEKHYFGCDNCWSEVQRATELRAALGGSPAAQKPPTEPPAAKVVRGPWTNWRWLAAAAAVGAVLVGGLLFVRRQSVGGSSPSLAVVIAALGTQRPLEPRIDALPYRPLAPVRRGTSIASATANEDLQAAAAFARKEADLHPSPETLRDLGLAQLLLGQFDRAVQTLEQASRQAPQNSSLRNDLAAAYLARAGHRTEFGEAAAADSDYEAALKVLNDVTAQNPGFSPALFNRALLLEEKHLPAEAIAAWQRYLSVDPVSPWASEARQHLARLNQRGGLPHWEQDQDRLGKALEAGDSTTIKQIALAYPQQTRQLAETTILGTWGATVGAAPGSVNGSLPAARLIGGILTGTTGNRMLQDSVHAIDYARDDARLLALAKGHQAYVRARLLYQKREISGALRLFRESARELNSGDSPFAMLAQLGEVSCQFYKSDFEKCLVTLDSLQRRSAGKSYLALEGQILWLRGLAQGALGYPNECRDSYLGALSRFEMLNEAENIATVHVLLAEAFRYLGQPKEASSHRAQAIGILTEIHDSPRLYQALGEAAKAYMADGQTELALLTETQLLTLAGNDPMLRADALLLRALGKRRAHRLDGNVLSDLAGARDSSRQIPDVELRARVVADLQAAEAHIEASSDSARALQNLNLAVDFFRRTRNGFRVAAELLERGRILRRLGRTELALKDFSDGIQEIENQRRRIFIEDLRVSYFETSRGLFEEAVEISIRRGDGRGAFRFAEEARAREMADALVTVARERHRTEPQVDGTTPPPEIVSIISTHLPEDVALVEYFLLKDRVVAWLLTRGRVRMQEIAVPAGRLEGEVAQFVDALRSDSAADARRLSTALYENLVSPALSGLGREHTIILVVDKCLHALPFAALQNPRTNRYLIEDFRIGFAPSATFLVSNHTPSSNCGPATLSALIFGSPAFAKDSFPDLAPLPAADEEARRIGATYSRSAVLTGTSATKRRFLELAPRARVVHYAGHAVLNNDLPAFSTLLMAPDGSDAKGLLYEHEISRTVFPATQLVFLGGCGTARGSVQEMEGVTSLARAFLAAGVPAVVATLWDIEDKAAAPLAVSFHKRMRAGDDAATALQTAQLDLLRGVDRSLRRPLFWAGYQMLGRISAFRHQGGRYGS